jgi:hypothetical protein
MVPLTTFNKPTSHFSSDPFLSIYLSPPKDTLSPWTTDWTQGHNLILHVYLINSSLSPWLDLILFSAPTLKCLKAEANSSGVVRFTGQVIGFPQKK